MNDWLTQWPLQLICDPVSLKPSVQTLCLSPSPSNQAPMIASVAKAKRACFYLLTSQAALFSFWWHYNKTHLWLYSSVSLLPRCNSLDLIIEINEINCNLTSVKKIFFFKAAYFAYLNVYNVPEICCKMANQYLCVAVVKNSNTGVYMLMHSVDTEVACCRHSPLHDSASP